MKIERKMRDLAALGLETKYCGGGEGLVLRDTEIEGYASLFGARDQGGDVVEKGAYADSLERLSSSGRGVKMLWQHDQTRPIGIWDEVREDARGLYVKGRILAEVQQGREALALLEAGAIDGLSIGYQTRRAERIAEGGRKLIEIDLWEVSVVTFPMLPEARVQGTGGTEDALATDLAEAFSAARAMMA